ncbi:MAG: hypothetical protein ACOC1S_03230, partial [bacterium]
RFGFIKRSEFTGYDYDKRPEATWSWYMNYIHLDEDTILQPFYTSDVQGCRSVQTMIARLDGERVIPFMFPML